MTDGSAVGLIAALGVLLLLSAFFSATETAYTSFSEARLKRLAERKKTAKLALRLSENYNKILSTLLIGNNIVNIAAASLATIVFTFYFGDAGVTVSTIVMTVLVLVFGEISPKSIAKERPEAFAAFSAYPLYVCAILFAPLNFLFEGWKRLLNKIFRLGKKRPKMTEEEFRIVVTDVRDDGVLNETEHDLIQNAIRYDETRVRDVMTPAERITVLKAGDGADKIRNIFEASNYSRIPVCSEDGTRFSGILYRVDFYEALLNGKDDFSDILKPLFPASPDEKISALFQKMQRAKEPLAVVAEAGGAVAGLVTVEDILEELVGEIDDKYDAERAGVSAYGRPKPDLRKNET